MGNGLGNAPIVAVALVALAAPAQAVTLVTPTGQPVGGQWQQWADEAHVPTLSGDLIVVVNDAVSMCAGADYGCSISPTTSSATTARR